MDDRAQTLFSGYESSCLQFAPRRDSAAGAILDVGYTFDEHRHSGVG